MLLQIKPRVKIDIDNVLNDLTRTMLVIYNERHNTNYALNECTSYDFMCFPDDMQKDLCDMFCDDELYERMRPADDAIHYLFLMMHEFDVKIVTSTKPDQLLKKLAWMDRWFPFVKWDDIIVCTDKKWIVADYTIDDHYGYLMGDIATRILIDMPWNRGVIDYAYSISRVANLKEAYQIITTSERELEEEYEVEI